MDVKRTIYLETAPVPEVLAAAREALDRESLIKTETVRAEDCVGRVTAAPVYARYSSPTFHSAAMDGIAVAAAKTYGAREGAPLVLKKSLDYLPVNTGNALPREPFVADAVIMVEHVVEIGPDAVSIEAPAFPWQHVRRIGEDIVATELLFPHNHRLSAYDIGALLAAGIWELSVFEQARLRIIPTGDEVLDFTKKPEPGPGQVVESNSQVLSALARAMGCLVERVPPVSDEPEALAQALSEALASPAHIVILCAGSSAGTRDYSKHVMERFGKILAHGIAAMPGKPSILGVATSVGPGKLMVGAPGYPVSAVVCFEELLAPLIAWMGRFAAPQRPTAPVILTRKTPSKLGMEEFLRLSIGKVQGRCVATPLGRGAGLITTLSRAQGIARIPANSEGVDQGETLTAELLVPEAALEHILVVIGSHDNTLDVLADELMGLTPLLRMASSHVGSMGGLMAVKNGSAHLAGAHLFDPEAGDEGEFNFSYLEKHLPGIEVLVVNLAVRHQGLITAKGNPKNIRGVADLARRDVRFINRQRGAGTRILLDHHLKVADIAPGAVFGYEKEETTHMAVAVNILTGAADCGLGIYAAAKALDLDFAPLARERYDLIIPASLREDPKILAVLELLHLERVKTKIAAQGGYETHLTGQIMTPGRGLG